MRHAIVSMFLSWLLLPLSSHAQELTAKQIMQQSEEKMRGESSLLEATMIIERADWSRTLAFKSWTLGTDYSLTLITAPAKEKGQTFLKRNNELWNWVPSISRMVKLPPSMMSQGWMGSDFSNDDIIKEFSLVEDYHHQRMGEETIDGHLCYKLELLPKENASVVWGKILKWISKDELLQMKTIYFDEEDYKIKTELASDIQEMDGRMIPTHYEILPEDEPGNKTIMEVKTMDFGVNLQPGFFSQQNMKRVR